MRLIYDGSCRTCVELAHWALARDRTGRLAIAPYQEPGLLERCHLSRQEAEGEVWLIDQTGERLGGPRAINRILWLQGGAWRTLAVMLGLPGLSLIESMVYKAFSRHRHLFDRAWPQRNRK